MLLKKFLKNSPRSIASDDSFWGSALRLQPCRKRVDEASTGRAVIARASLLRSLHIIAAGGIRRAYQNVSGGTSQDRFHVRRRQTGVFLQQERANAGELRRSVLAVEKAARELGWRPRISLAEGLQATVRFLAEG